MSDSNFVGDGYYTWCPLPDTIPKIVHVRKTTDRCGSVYLRLYWVQTKRSETFNMTKFKHFGFVWKGDTP